MQITETQGSELLKDSPVITWQALTYAGDNPVFWDKTFPGEIQHTRLLAPHKEPTTGQSMESSRVQRGYLVSFIGVTYRSRLTQRQCIIKVQPAW